MFIIKSQQYDEFLDLLGKKNSWESEQIVSSNFIKATGLIKGAYIPARLDEVPSVTPSIEYFDLYDGVISSIEKTGTIDHFSPMLHTRKPSGPLNMSRYLSLYRAMDARMVAIARKNQCRYVKSFFSIYHPSSAGDLVKIMHTLIRATAYHFSRNGLES